MAAAVGTSLLIIVLNSGSGFLGTLSHVEVDYSLIAALSATAVTGSFLGSRLATLVEPSSLRRAFASFVMAIGCLILLREGALVASTLAPALPSTWPQVVFALAMLGLGALAGRASKEAARRVDLVYQQGEGI